MSQIGKSHEGYGQTLSFFYYDGVQLNDISGNNIKPVICKTGNFSD